MDTLIAPYIAALEEFPITGTPAAKLRAAVRFAILAPSTRNTQPWTFHVERDTVLLYADRRRSLPVVDPDDRELTMSCGAALFNLRVTLNHFGYDPLVDLLPGPTDLMAIVTLGPAREPSEGDHALFDAIARRRTNRLAFDARPVGLDLIVALQRRAVQEGAWLTPVVDRGIRAGVADLTADAIRDQMTSRAFRRELAKWLHPRRTPPREGMPGTVMGLGDVASLAAPSVLRAFDLGPGFATRCRDLALSAPLLAVLSTRGDSVRDWLSAGQALQHVLLRAEMEGVSASFLNQAVEVPVVRPAIAAVLHRSDYPQLILRLGHGKPVHVTRRRGAEEVLV